MYSINLTTPSTRPAMAALRSEWVADAAIRARGRVVGVVGFGFGCGVDSKAPVTGARQGVRAWSPPV